MNNAEFSTTITDIRSKLGKGLFLNEASISQGIVLRLLNALGWPTWDTSVVAPEYSLSVLRVDFALCNPPNKAMVLIEVKQPGKAEGMEAQLFQYAFHQGVPLAILTDGQTWQFFLPTEVGAYAERRLHTLDLVERDPKDCVDRLLRYLAYDAIRDGTALKAAHADFTAQSREREASEALPKAWALLVNEGDSLLLDLLAEAAEQISGLKPTPEQTASYLQRLSVPFQANVPAAEPKNSTPLGASSGPVKARLGNQTWTEQSARAAFISIFKRLAERDESFLEHFAALPRHGRTRRYLARDRQELFPNRPDLQEQYSVEVAQGWWLGVNEGRSAMVRILKMAAEVASLQYGSQLELS